MDEQSIQKSRRDHEEQVTERRAQLLGYPYLDTREFENDIELVQNMLEISEMHQNYILPLEEGGGGKPYQFMITSHTPQSLIGKLQKQYTDDGEKTEFYMISDAAYHVFMLRYDPPK